MEKREKRILRVMLPNSGSGSTSPRLSLPISWTKEMGINKDDRDVEVTFDGTAIHISKIKKEILKK